jgi:hypothetical protein
MAFVADENPVALTFSVQAPSGSPVNEKPPPGVVTMVFVTLPQVMVTVAGVPSVAMAPFTEPRESA